MPLTLQSGFALAIALLSTAAVIATLLPRAWRLGLVDHPVGRKDHAAPIPVIGGIGMWFGLAVTFGGFGIGGQAGLGLLVAGFAVIVVGIADDHHDLPWKPRIAAQALAALLLAVIGGSTLERLGNGTVPVSLALGAAALPITVFAVVGLINAVNMVDGVDGLAGSVCLSSLLMMIVLARASGGEAMALDLGVCAAVVVAFLVFNLRIPGRPRALTFMGNGGSALLGLVLAWAAIRLTHDPELDITPALGPWLVAVPILDCMSLIWQRLRDGRSPFAADRGHLHHLLLDRGWSVSAVVAALVATNMIIAGVGFLLHGLGMPDLAMIGAFLLLIACHVLVAGILRKAAGAKVEHSIGALGSPMEGPQA